MRLTRGNLRRLIAEQYSNLNEAVAKNWDQYIAAGNSPESKEKRKKIKLRWDNVGGNKNLYPPEKVKSSASPAKFSNDYRGWTKWYFACIKDASAMKLIGKEAGKHINPDEMLAVYSAMIPPSNLEKAAAMVKSESDKAVVDEFMAGLDFGGTGMGPSEIAKLGKTPADKALDILTKTAAEYEKSNKSKSGETELSAEDLSKFTSGDDVRSPEMKPKRATDPSSKASTDVPVVEPGPASDRKSTVGPGPKTRPPRRFRRRKSKNESAQLTRDDIRKLIRESMKRIK